MENYKVVLVSGVTALVVLVGGLYLAPKTQVVNNPVKETIQEAVKEAVKRLGATPGKEITDTDFTVGGFTKITTRVPFNQATSSLCIVPKPHYATATLAFFGAVFNSGVATSAKGVDISLSVESSNDPKTLPFSTTSADVIGTYTVGRGAVNTVTASTSIGAAANILTRTATSAYAYLLVANQAAGDYRGYAPQGFCNVEWYVH